MFNKSYLISNVWRSDPIYKYVIESKSGINKPDENSLVLSINNQTPYNDWKWYSGNDATYHSERTFFNTDYQLDSFENWENK